MLGEGIEQLCVFAVFSVLGVGLTAIYIFGVGLTKTKLAAIIFDSVFGAAAIYVIWKVNLEVNNGECRAFLFVGLIAGVAITFVTCKRTLDKLSAMLYNLFTTKQVDDDGKTILQKMDSDTIRNGDTDTGIATLHATGKSRSAVVGKRSHSKVRTAVGRGRRYNRRTPSDARVPSIRRFRETMGRTARQDKSR